MRDKRFVAAHRGGQLSKENHRLLIAWAYTCVTHVLQLLEQSEMDDRLSNALKSAKAWEQDKISVGEARNSSLEAIAVANESSNPVPISVARSIGHAVATAHMADHSLRAADYALKAVKLSGKSVETERRWQDKQLPPDIKDLVLSARHEKPYNKNV
jgi:hypothetical protein